MLLHCLSLSRDPRGPGEVERHQLLASACLPCDHRAAPERVRQHSSSQLPTRPDTASLTPQVSKQRQRQ